MVSVLVELRTFTALIHSKVTREILRKFTMKFGIFFLAARNQARDDHQQSKNRRSGFSEKTMFLQGADWINLRDVDNTAHILQGLAATLSHLPVPAYHNLNNKSKQ